MQWRGTSVMTSVTQQIVPNRCFVG